jgi:hypothetical protein
VTNDVPSTQPSGQRLPPPRHPRTARATAEADRVWYVYYGATIVGHTRFEVPLNETGRAAGRFYPTPAYEEVQPVFAALAAALSRHVASAVLAERLRARDALGLWLTGRDGILRQGYVEHLSAWEAGVIIVHAVIPDFVPPSAEHVRGES